MLSKLKAALINVFSQERDRWILWIPVGLGGGISLYFGFRVEPGWTILLSITLVLLLVAFALRKTFWGLILISFAMGLCLAKARTEWIHTLMLQEKVQVTFQGKVIGIEQFPHKSRALVELSNMPVLPKRVRLTFAKSNPLELGDRIEVTANLFPLPDPLSPQGYDFRRAAFFHNLGASGHIVILHSQIPNLHKFKLDYVRNYITQEFRKNLPGDKGEIAAALVTGDRSGITPSIRQAYADAGIAHILAISGLHLSLVAGLCFFIVRRGLCLVPLLAERYAIKKWAAVCAILLTAAYLALSGFAIPAKRAFIMTTLVLGGILFDRQALSMRSLAIAATGILAFWPEALLTASFQLSFAAVVALIAAYERKSQRLDKRLGWGKIGRYFFEIGFATVIATLATTPFTIALFNRFTLQAVLANLVAIPLAGLWIMPFAMISTFSLLIGGWNWAFTALGWGLTFLTECATWIATLPGAIIRVPTPSCFFVGAITLGGLWFCLWQKPLRFFGLIPISFAIMSLYLINPPDALIAGDGSLIAIRQGRTLWLSSERQLSLYKEFWTKELGISQTRLWSAPDFNSDRDILFIDQSQRKVYRQDMQTLCSLYRIIVSNGYLKYACQQASNPVIIDKRDLIKGGTLALWFNPQGLIVQSVRDTLGNRPWSPLSR